MDSASSSSAAKSQFSDDVPGVVEENPNEQKSETLCFKEFCFADLETATSNFRPEALLGEGANGRVYKGWIDKKTLAPTESGTGMAVAVRLWNPENISAFEQWQVIAFNDYLGIYDSKLPSEQLEGQYSSEAAEHATQLTLKCLEVNNHKDRPSMKEVLEVLLQVKEMTSMKEVPELLEQIEAVTSMKEVSKVLEHNETLEEKPNNSKCSSPRSTAPYHSQPRICHRFLTSLRATCQCVSSKLNCMKK